MKITKRLVIAFLLLVISVRLYFISKAEINAGIINISAIIFIVNLLLLEGKNIINGLYISFNTVFSVSFFFASYAFALFIAQSDLLQLYLQSGPSQIRYVNFDYVTKGTSLASVSYSLYTIGYLLIKYKKSKIPRHCGVEGEKSFWIFSNRFFNLFFWLTLINMSISIINPRDGGIVMFMDRAFIYEYFRLFLVFVLFATRMLFPQDTIYKFKELWVLYKRPFKMSAIIIFIFLLYGERGEPLLIILILFGFIYFYCVKIKVKTLVLIGVVGLFVMNAIKFTRKTDNSITKGGIVSVVNTTRESVSESSPILLFSDLIGATNELCYGIEITEKKGIQHPEQFLLLPFYPIPFMPSIMSYILMGMPLKDLSPITSLNEEMRDIVGQSCFGNHVVVDIYMRWGFVGNLLAFFILGIVVSFYSRYKQSNIIMSICFLLLFSNSLYLPRGTMLGFIREISNVYIFVYVYKRFFRAPKDSFRYA